ncbi:pectin lyase [Boeremia exigua]|uniref:pectin lyase n=1 Tax=Boeremia exigua TaxID=749465 RepID=UPI001E8D10A1|nr:pectin lyase [Boeremia exigua]KAH6619894.1 pectin lyase [Boeremia exigua]
MRFEFAILFAAIGGTTAQKVVGKAYGFGAGATGGGSAAAVKPKDAAELKKLLADDVARTIVLDKTFDFTGSAASGVGCDRKSCSSTSGGQLYLGDLSCGGSDNVAKTVKYNSGGTSPLVVGSNKSILGVGGKGIIKGTGLQVKANAKNVIVQGIELTTINPGVVWGGDALDLKGGNSQIWIDHCKFSKVGRMFVVSHYNGASVTLSNNVFDGVTSTSASCNKNHYWGLMFIGKNEKATLDKNYFHDQSGRAPKLGQNGVSGTFHAINNYFENMKGHAFDAYTGANALIEGNAFKAVSQPSTDSAAKVATFITNATSGCKNTLGRVCIANSIDSTSGKLGSGSNSGFVSTIKSVDVPTKLSADKVAAHVKANAGPAKLTTSSKFRREMRI